MTDGAVPDPPAGPDASPDAEPDKAVLRRPAFASGFPAEDDFADTVSEQDDSDGWQITYMDTITLLLTLFVLFFAIREVASPPTQDAFRRALADVTSARPSQSPVTNALGPGDNAGSARIAGDSDEVAAFREGLSASGLGDRVDVSYEQERIVIRIADRLLFGSGQAELVSDGEEALSNLAPVLKVSDGEIEVEGHTDDVPISTERFPSNWELSGSRAGAVVRWLIERGIDAKRFRATGFAETRPVADNATADGRAANRRVMISLRLDGEQSAR